MKKVLLSLMFLAVMSSCSTVKYKTYSSMVDFRPYMEKGFFITQSNSVSFDYEPIGCIQAVAVSGQDKNKSVDKQKKDYGDGLLTQGRFHEVSINDAIEELYNQCLKNNANGVLDLKMDIIVNQAGIVEKAIVTGMAIKKKK